MPVDPLYTIVTGVLLSLATAYFTSKFYVRRVRADLQKEFESRFNQRKWEAYREFGKLLRDITLSSKEGKTAKEQHKFIRRFYDFLPEVWLVASDRVTRAFLSWRSTSIQSQVTGSASPESLLNLFQILIEMRKDLGYEKTKLAPEELLGTFIDDVDWLLKQASGTAAP